MNSSFQLDGLNTHFVSGTTTADFGPGIQQLDLNVTSPTQIFAHMFIHTVATPGLHTVTVTTGSEVVRTSFTVTTPCNASLASTALGSISPNTTTQGTQNFVVQLTAQAYSTTYFVQGVTTADFGPGITANLTVNSPTSATATLSINSSAPAGPRDVTLKTSGETATASQGFTVIPMLAATTMGPMTLSVVPTITSSSSTAMQGAQNVVVTFTGNFTHFAQGTTRIDIGPGITVNPVTVTQPGSAIAVLSIAQTAIVGPRDIKVTTGAEVVSLPQGFNVTAAGTSFNRTPVAVASGLTSTKMTSTSAATSTSTTSVPSSSTYRVTMTGLMCLKAITGGGDAIYGAAVIRQYDRRNGQATMFTNANTWVYGDTNGMIDQRKQAGSRGPMGGIGAGDFVPTGFIVGPKDTLPPQPNVFPMALWQGTLTNGVDALVISPSLWISYGDNSMFFNWNQNEDPFTNSIFLDSHVQNQINTQTFGASFFGTSQNVSNSAASSLAGDATVAATEELIQASGLTFGIPVGVFAITGPSYDRPIGVMPANSNDITSSTILPNATLVLTREMIEKRLGSNAWTVINFDFRDLPIVFSNLPNTDRPGGYTMFIQIERQ